MNRTALLIYLQDVRDLEVARYRLNELIKQANNEYDADVAQIKQAGRHQTATEAPDTSTLLGDTLKCGLLTVVSVVLVITVLASLLLLGISGLLLALIGLAILYVILFGLNRGMGEKDWGLLKYRARLNDVKAAQAAYEAFCAEVEAYNRKVDEEAAERTELSKKALAHKNAIEQFSRDELSKVEPLLERYYALNILPSQYRSLVPVCYIYEYMSTSQATLEDTLMHEHVENGFQRLEAKLDQVIATVEDLIYETRVLRAENREQAERLARQNQLQLKLLERTEQNTADAARYAQLAECNTAACAYFELATYLKD